MTRRVFLFLIAVILIAGAVWFLQRPKPAPSGMQLSAVAFGDLPGWSTSNGDKALAAFRLSCGALAKKAASDGMGGAGYAGTVGDWVQACNGLAGASNPRRFFETNFKPFAISFSGRRTGLFTGYYEPELRASRTRHGVYQTAVYGVPSDLITVDLGATATVHSVMLQWDPAYATAYKLQVSNDNVNWTDIYSTTTGTGFKQTLTGLNGTGRYVRMYGTARSSAYGYSLWEFEVFGTGGSPNTPPASPPNVTLPATHLVFDDEFNGAAGATPDASKWTPETGTGQNGELEYYTDNKNATMDGNGDLVITAKKEVTPGSACPTDPLTGSGTCQYTSGRINTANKFSFTYGHVEARIKVSGTQGLWPAFWLLGADFPTAGWPGCGEIDIMEHVGKVPDAVYSTIHAPAYNGGGGLGSPYTLTGTDFASGFHTYAVDWDASHMTFSVDGNAFFTLNKADVEAAHGPWVYDHPFFIILNNAIGGDWPGGPDATTTLPQQMVIDYVRVYQ